MKKKWIAGILAGCMALSFAACAGKEEDSFSNVRETNSETDAVAETEKESQETKETESETEIVETAETKDGYVLDFTESEKTIVFEHTWMDCIYQMLTEVRKNNEVIDDANPEYANSYFLYDMNQDEVPELFIAYGSCEADAHMIVYEVFQDEMVHVGEIASGHSSFYAVEGGLLQNLGHMGYQEMNFIYQDGDGFVYEQAFSGDFNDKPEEDYKEPTEFYKEAVKIPQYRLELDFPLLQYDGQKLSTKVEIPDEQVIEILENTKDENGQVIGVTGDGYGGACGLTSFDEYIKAGVVGDYMSQDGEVKECTFVDLNGDGQSEALLKVYDSDSSFIYVVLSVQDHKVYAYSIHYLYNYECTPEGVLINTEYQDQIRVQFYADECYLSFE